ncbi:hypothetical protein CU098_008943 [Rhizopus stolonifer]|uniref:Zinc finger CCCH domain-containing protein 14 n=1 Tax=Rhizopus stolonifer TaxID=4846 RepID=A0A367JRU1_RHIST|nr:hypothetical protein CU098_008943 [Rhizopus stolonifer]
MDSEKWELLKNEIHNKCVTYDYIDAADSTLAEFIVNLVQVGKNAVEVNNELGQYPNVTQWIFARKHELESALPAAHQQQQQQQEEPMETHDPKPKNRIFSRALGHALNNNTSNSDRPRLTSSGSPHRLDRSRSRSRSPVRHSTRYERDSSRHDRRHDHRESRQEDRPSVFDRLGTSKPIPKPSPVTEETKKERCKYWPTCKNGKECPYFHPSKVCRDFPNCPKKANECMFIHPETSQPPLPVMTKLPIPCKFFPYCNNPVCPYMHPTPQQQQAFFMQTQPSFTPQRVQVPCKNGDACTRPDCHFIHPRDPNPLSDVICKFDGACTRPNCFYKHTKENKNKVLINKPENTSSRHFSVPEDQVNERIPVGQSADVIQQEQQQVMDVDRDVVMDATS